MMVTGSQLELSAQAQTFRLSEHQTTVRIWNSGDSSPDKGAVTPFLAQATDSTAHGPADKSKVGTVPLSLTAMILERFFGLKVTVITPEDMAADEERTDLASGQNSQSTGDVLGWGMEVTSTSHTIQEDDLQFSANGRVTTSDGRELSFSLDLQMNRRLEQTQTLNLRMGNVPVDPLVLQLKPGFSEPSDQTFAFDLDGDGKLEDVPVLQSGAFFLIFDENRDGQIKNGAELLGPTSGDGFSELRQLDQDGNDWIDEADPSFFSLRLWQPDSQGMGNLISLLDAGVGALSVDSVSSPWDMNHGYLSESSIFLTETGEAGHLGEMLLQV